MKHLSLIIFLIISNCSLAQLYPFQQEGKWGYINAQSEVVIEPRFEAAKFFFNGLAAVREDGYYGFIDEDGDWVKTPEYDFTEGFNLGKIAVVYINGTPTLINRDFEIIRTYHSETFQIYYHENCKYLVVTDSINKRTIINLKGETMIASKDLRFFQLDESTFMGIKESGNRATLYNLDSGDSSQIPKRENFHIETHGDVIISRPLVDEFQWAYIYSFKGKLLDSIESKYIGSYTPNFKDGVAVTIIQKSEEELTTNSNPNGLIQYKIEIQRIGEDPIEIPEAEHKHEAISGGRALIKHGDRKYYLYNRDGEIQNEVGYDDIVAEYLIESLDLAYIPAIREGKLVLIDSRNRERETTLPGGHLRDNSASTGLIIYEHSSVVSRNENYSFDFINLQTGVWSHEEFKALHLISPTVMLALDSNNHRFYIEADGTKIKIPEVDIHHFGPLNIDYQFINEAYVASPRKAAHNGIGGWAQSDRMYKPIQVGMQWPDTLIVHHDNSVVPWEMDPNYYGNTITLANNSSDTFLFKAQDSRLHTVLEAQRPDGTWVEIQEFQYSWCGNSDHYVFLPPGHAWSWTIPQVEGAVETMFRIKVWGIRKSLELKPEVIAREREQERIRDSIFNANNPDENSIRPNRALPINFLADHNFLHPTFTIYSLPYKGSINPAQLWRRGEYFDRINTHYSILFD